ncbi:MAG: C40 family peptidase [Clostridia bacterium]|nr:C40 family peptidase [Clostridia bacterium]
MTKNTLRKTLSILITATLLLALLPGSVISVSADMQTSSVTAEQVIARANELNGKTDWRYNDGQHTYCLLFVSDFWSSTHQFPDGKYGLGFQGSYGYGNAYNYCDKFRVSTSMDNIPVGADVFFDDAGYSLGHIGIYLGNGKFLNASGEKIRISSFYNDSYEGNFWGNHYLGWGWHEHVTVTNHNPIGHADEIVGGDGEVFIRGWAFDYDDPGASLQLHVYIGGYADDPDAEVHTGIYADGDRQDINNSYSVPGNHGYKTYIKTNKTGGQYVCIYAINKGEGNNVLIGREWVSITSNNPIGHADEIVGGDGEVFIRGWAFDYNDPGASLGLNVYIGGPAGDDNAECHTGIIANGDRNDINSAYGISGNHGFKTYIQTDKVGGQYVYIYAVNKGAGNDSLIAKEWVNITHHSPIGHGDEIKGGDGEIFIRGWAFDPDEPGMSIQLHVYIGGSAGDPTSEPHTGIYANGDRQDINDAYGIPGDHGFKTYISTDKRGWQKVYIYGINIGEGSNIPHFAEAEVYINPPHTHSYTSAVTPPTCTKQGYTTHTCSCGDSYVDTYVDALGHQWDSGTITVAPTTTTPGIVTYTCTVCGEERMEIVPKLEASKGDADGDGKITVADALSALRIAAKLIPETPKMIAICDTDGDGSITVSDALAILRVAAKLVASL